MAVKPRPGDTEPGTVPNLLVGVRPTAGRAVTKGWPATSLTKRSRRLATSSTKPNRRRGRSLIRCRRRWGRRWGKPSRPPGRLSARSRTRRGRSGSKRKARSGNCSRPIRWWSAPSARSSAGWRRWPCPRRSKRTRSWATSGTGSWTKRRRSSGKPSRPCNRSLGRRPPRPLRRRKPKPRRCGRTRARPGPPRRVGSAGQLGRQLAASSMAADWSRRRCQHGRQHALHVGGLAFGAKPVCAKQAAEPRSLFGDHESRRLGAGSSRS